MDETGSERSLTGSAAKDSELALDGDGTDWAVGLSRVMGSEAMCNDGVMIAWMKGP